MKFLCEHEITGRTWKVPTLRDYKDIRHTDWLRATLHCSPFSVLFFTLYFSCYLCSFDDGDFDDAEEDEGLDDLENVEDVSFPPICSYLLARY